MEKLTSVKVYTRTAQGRIEWEEQQGVPPAGPETCKGRLAQNAELRWVCLVEDVWWFCWSKALHLQLAYKGVHIISLLLSYVSGMVYG